MNQRILHKVFVWGFLFLYLLVAGISFCHAVEFFSIGNPTIMSAVLAFAFELGLSLSLAAILLSDSNKNKALPWILMVILTSVQVIGNVYSTFKYIALSDVDYYVYLQKPLLFWIEEVSQDTVQVIISWIIGAILPIVALFMTDMVATNLKDMQNSNLNLGTSNNIDKKEKEIPLKNDINADKEYENDETTDTSLKNVVVHEEPIKTTINESPKNNVNDSSINKKNLVINKNVDENDTSLNEDEVANRDKRIKQGYHVADDPYFNSPTTKK